MTTPVFLFSSLDDQSALGGLYFFANGGVYNPSGPNPAAQVAYLEQFASTAYAKICASKAEATFSASQCQHTSAEASFLNNLTVGGVTEYQALVNWFFLGNPTPNLVEPPVNYCNRGFYCNPSSSLALNAVCVGPGVDNASNDHVHVHDERDNNDRRNVHDDRDNDDRRNVHDHVHDKQHDAHRDPIQHDILVYDPEHGRNNQRAFSPVCQRPVGIRRLSTRAVIV